MFTAVAADDRAVQRLVPRVRLVVDEDYDARFPAHRGARVGGWTLSDGRRRAVDVPDRSGSPERPLSDEQLAEKFVATVAPLLGDGSRAVLAAVRGSVPSPRRYLPLISANVKPAPLPRAMRRETDARSDQRAVSAPGSGRGGVVTGSQRPQRAGMRIRIGAVRSERVAQTEVEQRC